MVEPLIHYVLKKKVFFLFITGAGIGFLTDISLFELLRRTFNSEPILTRTISLTLSLVVSYYFHRAFTFKEQENRVIYSFPRFISSCAVMQTINFLIFTGLIVFSRFFHDHAYLAIAIGSFSVMFLSFLIAKVWVFNEKSVH